LLTSRALVLLSALGLSATALAVPAKSPLVRPLGRAQVDWGAGVVSAPGKAAADLRMPGPDAARADAVRDARLVARATLRAALVKLPLGRARKVAPADLEAAVARATILSAEYQSNGGVSLDLGLSFLDLHPQPQPPKQKPPPTEIVLSIPSMPFEAAPVLLAGTREIPLQQAVYRLGKPPRGERPVRARRDRQGRLSVSAAAIPERGPLHTRAIIYLRNVPRR
jgi:hypothetical protein